MNEPRRTAADRAAHDQRVRQRASRVVDALRRDPSFGGTVRDDEVTRSLYSSNASICYRRPAAVVVPDDADDVVRVMELAGEHQVPVTPRGAGSSVAGQSLGNGIILDFSPRMNRLLAVHENSHSVTVEPGIIRDRLNIALKEHGLWFPPDPSSGAFCTIGGMIANNSGGAHSLKYGTTKHYVDEVELVLADGSRAVVRAPDRSDHPAPLGTRPKVRTSKAVPHPLRERAVQLTEHVAAIVARHRDALRADAPTTSRCSSGYNLFEAETPDGVLDLTRVLCGSEGTLGVIVRATLRLLPLPKARTGLVLYFDDEQAAYAAVPRIVERCGPSTVQAMSRDLLQAAADASADEARRTPGGAERPIDPPDRRLAVMLLVEFDGDDERALRVTAERCEEAFTEPNGPAYWARVAETAEELSAVWVIRKSAAAVLSRMPGAQKPTRWIEDGAVPPERLPEFIAGLRRMFAEHDIDATLFGHAGQGLMHFSPPMDKHAPDFAARIERIGHAHADLLRAVGGVPSGEHGDGLLRTPLLPEFFPESYEAFRETKRLFDPQFVLNPAVIVPSPEEAGAGIASHLRHGSHYGHATVGGRGALDTPDFRAAVELCHGCNACRTYCPVVGLGDDEEHLPRAKANLLRDLISGVLPADDAFSDDRVLGVIDYCASCGLCLDRCPTHVDIPGISNTFRAEWNRRQGHAASRADTVLARPDVLTTLATLAPVVANASLRSRTVRRVLERLVGLAADAPMPTFRRGSLRAPRISSPTPVRLWDRDITEVAVFVSCEHRGADQAEVRALTAVLARLGIRAHLLADSPCCARPLVTAGQMDDARPMLARHRRVVVEQWQAGRPTLVVTPSCLTPFVHQLPELWPEDARLADALRGCVDATEFVAAVLGSGEGRGEVPAAIADDRRIVVHSPCSLRATGPGTAPLRLLQRAGARHLQPVDVRCCGALGTWSLKADHIDDSRTISESLVQTVAAMDPRPDIIASPAGNCRRWIESRTDIPTVHPLVLLADWLAG